MSHRTVEEFNKNGYCVVKKALSNELCEFITQYALFDEMQDFTPDGHQVPTAHSKYADPAMESVLLKLQHTMEKNTGFQLFPTYSFYRVYRNGDELKIHKDRESCEISSTFCFGYNYVKDTYSWPIFMNGNPVNLEPGDMVIYKGCELDHWREKFNVDEDKWHIQGFFHYVNANGPYSDFKYDNRKSVGCLDNNTNFKKDIKTPRYIEYVAPPM